MAMVGRADGGQDDVRWWGGEDVAACRGVGHPETDVPAESRLVPRSATHDDAYLAAGGRTSYHDARLMQSDQRGVRVDEAVEGLVDHVERIIDQFLEGHGNLT